MLQCSRYAMLVPWPVLSSISSRNGSKTGFLHSPEAASPRDNLFPRSRISRFAMVCSCKAQDSQWSLARNYQVSQSNDSAASALAIRTHAKPRYAD
ncbi:hypothetical protein Ddc_16189 [Ditylenchus destructor]|nr:hypothetical protein Ddc_16189 [Ditylenchus destructor]